MDINKQIVLICQKEIENGCYDAKIDGVSLYSYIRDDVRREVLIRNGHSIMSDRGSNYSASIVVSLIKSIWHICKLICLKKHSANVFYPFARVDKLGGLYIDKFTDPIIETCNLTDYLILDRGRAGDHPKPRLHSENCYYVDILQLVASVKSVLFYKYLIKKYDCEFTKLHNSLSVFNIKLSEPWLFKRIVFFHYYSSCFEWLLRKIKSQRVIGPSRAQQLPIFIAARKLGIETLELQHGVTYGETVAYSGYRDPMVLPDKFLAFGENDPQNVYGISEDKIVNIGFALFDFIDKQSGFIKYKDTDVLVVSEPEITEKMISIVIHLSDDNPLVNFYFRPHPHEFLTTSQVKILKSRSNVHIQDKSINIIEVLHGFNLVVGESSTVLYEALSMKKKVGRLHYEGLNPLYLSDNDKKSFWQISNQDDFLSFLGGELTNDVRSIYSPFNNNKMKEILATK